jgi:hypothetical protein
MNHFDPETLLELRAVFDDVCAMLPAAQQSSDQKSAIAERILKLAAQGERDPHRLRDGALTRIA